MIVAMKAVWIAATIAMLACSSASAKSPAGHYRLIGEQDVASELVLKEDGHFLYALAAGALDEHAEGRWTSDGKTVWLTTEPKPRPAVFRAGPAARTAEAPLRVRITWPDGRGIPGVDFAIGFDSGSPITDYTQEDGWSLPPDEKRSPSWLEFALPMYALKSQRFVVDPTAANDLTFVIEPNDLGVADFQELTLTIGNNRLLMPRYEGTLTYVAKGQNRARPTSSDNQK
ncbi:MAG TPA: hypothetical protein VJR87_00075 [Allosphingosinicella sp.]|nr:hypothetical protein [Allosphingosinicella sp.]